MKLEGRLFVKIVCVVVIKIVGFKVCVSWMIEMFICELLLEKIVWMVYLRVLEINFSFKVE